MKPNPVTQAVGETLKQMHMAGEVVGWGRANGLDEPMDVIGVELSDGREFFIEIKAA